MTTREAPGLHIGLQNDTDPHVYSSDGDDTRVASGLSLERTTYVVVNRYSKPSVSKNRGASGLPPIEATASFQAKLRHTAAVRLSLTSFTDSKQQTSKHLDVS